MMSDRASPGLLVLDGSGGVSHQYAAGVRRLRLSRMLMSQRECSR